MRIEIYAKAEKDGTWTAQTSSLGPGHAGSTISAASKEGALHMAREEVRKEAGREAEVVEVPMPLSAGATQMLLAIVRGMVVKFKEEGGVPGQTIPLYVLRKETLPEEEELLAGEYIERVQGGFRVTRAGLRAGSGVHHSEGDNEVFTYLAGEAAMVERGCEPEL